MNNLDKSIKYFLQAVLMKAAIDYLYEPFDIFMFEIYKLLNLIALITFFLGLFYQIKDLSAKFTTTTKKAITEFSNMKNENDKL